MLLAVNPAAATPVAQRSLSVYDTAAGGGVGWSGVSR
jgi:hypothetical protein